MYNTSKEKYQSPLYYLDGAAQALEEARKSIEKLAEVRGQICVFTLPITTGYGDGKTGLEYETDVKWYWNCRDTTFSGYGNYQETWDKPEKITKTYDNCVAYLDKVLETLERRHEANLPAIEANQKARQNIVDFITSYGISDTKYVESGKGKNARSVSVAADWKSDIFRQIPVDDGYKAYKEKINEVLYRAKEWRDKLLKEIRLKQEEQQKAAQKEEDYLRMVLWCQKQGHDVTKMTRGQIMAKSFEAAEQTFIEEECEGQEITIHCCEECNNWKFGAELCSCGETPIDYNIEHDDTNGFYLDIYKA